MRKSTLMILLCFIMIFSACQSVEMHTVIFDIDGWEQTGGGMITQQVPHGTSLLKTPLIEQENMWFIAWNTSLEAVHTSLVVSPIWLRIIGIPQTWSRNEIVISIESNDETLLIETRLEEQSFNSYQLEDPIIITKNTTLYIRYMFHEEPWIELEPIQIEYIDQIKPSPPRMTYYLNQEGQINISIIGGNDHESGISHHEVLQNEEHWITFNETWTGIIDNETQITTRSIDQVQNVSEHIQKTISIHPTNWMNKTNQSFIRYRIKEINHWSSGYTQTIHSLKGEFDTHNLTYDPFIVYPIGSAYRGCGIKAGQIVMAWYGVLWTQTEVEAYVPATLVDWLDSNIFTTPLQLETGIQTMINLFYDDVIVMRYRPYTIEDVVGYVENALQKGSLAIMLVNDGDHWQVISESIVIRDAQGIIREARFLVHDNEGANLRRIEDMKLFFEDGIKARLARMMGYASYVNTIMTIGRE